MTEEQVTEAVKQGIETLKPKAMSAAKDVFNTVLDAYSQGFWEGVGIAINCLWHEADEEPKKGKGIIVLYMKGLFLEKGCYVSTQKLSDGSYEMNLKDNKRNICVLGAEKWLYVKDLLPKEEQQ